MSYLKTICGLLMLLMAGMAWSADTLTPEQKEVKHFIEKMYSYDPETFEYGNFLKKTGAPLLRNQVPSGFSAIKYLPEKMCSFLGEYFDEGILEKKKRKSGVNYCAADSGLVHIRYPYLGDEDLSSATRGSDIPSPYITPPVVSGSRAKVEVFPAGNKKISNPPNFDLGRNLYFLTKSETGWHVTNVMIHTKWPDLDDGTHHCYFSFAKAPNDEEAKEIPKHCRR